MPPSDSIVTAAARAGRSTSVGFVSGAPTVGAARSGSSPICDSSDARSSSVAADVGPRGASAAAPVVVGWSTAVVAAGGWPVPVPVAVPVVVAVAVVAVAVAVAAGAAAAGGGGGGARRVAEVAAPVVVVAIRPLAVDLAPTSPRSSAIASDHSGTLPCLRRGSSSRLVASIRSPATSFWRVSAGSITSSM